MKSVETVYNEDGTVHVRIVTPLVNENGNILHLSEVDDRCVTIMSAICDKYQRVAFSQVHGGPNADHCVSDYVGRTGSKMMKEYKLQDPKTICSARCLCGATSGDRHRVGCQFVDWTKQEGPPMEVRVGPRGDAPADEAARIFVEEQRKVNTAKEKEKRDASEAEKRSRIIRSKREWPTR